MKKIICFSDLHGQISSDLSSFIKNEPADILIYAGDIQRNNYDDGSDFLDLISLSSAKYKIITYGNHDGNYIKILIHSYNFPYTHFLCNNSISIDGIHIFGSPYSLEFGGWWFMRREEELEKMYAEIPEDTNILITHTPAFGILDTTIMGDHAGSKSLLKRIGELKKLKWHICGHIHEAYGVQSIGSVHSVNVSLVDEHYRLVRNPTIIYYREEK